MLKIENLNVHFGDFHAVKDVSLEIPDGTFRLWQDHYSAFHHRLY